MISGSYEKLKKCSNCQKLLGVSSYAKNRKAASGLQNECKTCKNARARSTFAVVYATEEGRERSLAATRRGVLARTLAHYGLTRAQYDAFVAAGCAICKGPPNGTGRYAFDHDHETGKFRGLLCSKCNCAIGLLEDDTEVMQFAINYIVRSRE